MLRNGSTVAGLSLLVLCCPILADAKEVTLREGRSIAMAPPRPVTWIGFAVSRRGRVFRVWGRNEAAAKANAKNECEQTTATTCRAISVPKTWNVSAVSCPGGTFVAGSGEGSAMPVAILKANAAGIDGDRCREIFTN